MGSYLITDDDEKAATAMRGERKCDQCGNPADKSLISNVAALCYRCWDGKETPLETKERLGS